MGLPRYFSGSYLDGFFTLQSMSLTPNFKVAVVQMTSTDNLGSNLTFALEQIERAGSLGADLIVFPENALFMRLEAKSQVVTFNLVGSEGKQIAQAVEKYKLPALLTTPVAGPEAKSFNSTVYWEPGSAPRVVYSKIHLFDVDVPGAPPMRESEHFHSGLDTSILTIKGWKFGLSICYDLRFAELYNRYAGKVDAILIPSSFLVPTGEAHWHVLLRARAIENQCFVIAPAQVGPHISSQGSKRHTYGHSLVVDPWGEVLLDQSSGAGTTIIELDPEKTLQVRRQIPMHNHRRML